MKKNLHFIITITLLCLSNIFIYSSIIFPHPLNNNAFAKDFPSNFSNWKGREVSYDEELLSQLGPDKIVYKTYYKKDMPPITVFMACYNTLEKANLSHSPVVCFTGQGWDISDTSTVEIPAGTPDMQHIKVNQMLQTKQDKKMITLYWYQSYNKAFHNRGIQKIFLFFDRLIGNPEHNAFIRVTAYIPQEEKNADIKTTSESYDFMREFYPEVRRYFFEY